ncbi:MAG: hypothetical protein WA441_06990 [Methyloceanibacter sp.]
MSDPLDITHLIDAKVAAVKRTVAWSKQVAVWAKEDLDKHERWLQGYRVLAAEDLKRHQRRLKRRRTIRACQQTAISLILLVPSICAALFHGAIWALICLGNLLSISGFWIGAKAHALGVWLVGLLSLSCLWIGVQARTCGLWLIAVLSISCSWVGVKARALGVWLVGLLSLSCLWIGVQARTCGLWLIELLSISFSWVGVRARALALRLIDLVSRNLSWTGVKASALGRGLIELLSIGFSQVAVKVRPVGLWLEEIIERQLSQLLVRLGFDNEALDGTRDAIRASHRDERRIQEAAFTRLRAEHEGLQNRIHAMDKAYGQRFLRGGRASGAANKEWVQLRELARNARRLFEMQERHLLNSSRASGCPGVVNGTGPLAPIHSLKTGHDAR